MIITVKSDEPTDAFIKDSQWNALYEVGECYGIDIGSVSFPDPYTKLIRVELDGDMMFEIPEKNDNPTAQLLFDRLIEDVRRIFRSCDSEKAHV